MQDKKYLLSDFDFELPEELIAQYPSDKRDNSKLMHVKRGSSSFEHFQFYDLPSLLKKGDVLVFNNAKVIPARLFFRKESGAMVEVVLAKRTGKYEWLVLTNKTKRFKPGSKAFSLKNSDIFFEVIDRRNEYLHIKTNIEFTEEILEEIGNIPLPPYIKRDIDELDVKRYQTVYASQSGSVAAPTAGLHFTNEIFSELQKRKIETLYLTLDVGWGTFSPVRNDDLEKHDMHTESFVLAESTAAAINKARDEKRRIIAVGTTSLRVLESTFQDGYNIPGKGDTNIFIYPPYKIKSIDGLITNFHTPKSTLLMLIAAFGGYDLMMNAYKVAIEEKYRFFSYGDSMFID